MAKLSTQLKSTTPTRAGRTERQVAKQERAKQIATDTKQFQDLKSRAEEVQEQKFSDVVTIQQYQEVYNSIDPELQQFFQTPTQIRTSQTERVASSRIKLQSEIERIEGLKKQQDDAYQRSLAEIPFLEPRGRADFRRDIKQEHRVATASIDAELGGLRSGLSQLNAGQDISVGEIRSFAKARAGESADVEIKAFKRTSQSVRSRTIDANYLMGKMSGLTSEGSRIVRNATGGSSDVEIFSVKGGERIQVVREQDTGKIYYTDLAGKNKGEKIQAQGLSDPEIKAQADAYAIEISKLNPTTEIEIPKDPDDAMDVAGTKLISWGRKGLDISKAIIVYAMKGYKSAKPIIRKTVGTIPLFSIAGAGQSTMAGAEIST